VKGVEDLRYYWVRRRLSADLWREGPLHADRGRCGKEAALHGQGRGRARHAGGVERAVRGRALALFDSLCMPVKRRACAAVVPALCRRKFIPHSADAAAELQASHGLVAGTRQARAGTTPLTITIRRASDTREGQASACPRTSRRSSLPVYGMARFIQDQFGGGIRASSRPRHL
jgi:hypothetical protein